MRKLLSLLIFLPVCSIAQDDLMDMLEGELEAEAPTRERVIATFKTMKVVNAHSIETVKERSLDFRITHRFGNMGVASNGGAHTLYGFDTSEDIRFSFDYGITSDLQIGVGRSKQFENLDGSVKWRFLSQTTDNGIPVSAVWLSTMAYSPQINEVIGFRDDHRFTYNHQLIIGRKFGSRISFEVLPTINHRNIVVGNINESNGAEEDNTLFALGLAARVKLTQRMALLADYFIVFSDYRSDNTVDPYYNPLGIGLEIETGGHVFHITLTNSMGIMENTFIPYSPDSWLNGGYKLGFNISRVFKL